MRGTALTISLESVNVPFLDREGRVFAVKPKKPSGWEDLCRHIDAATDELHAAVGPHTSHRRGDFATARWGYSYGMGQEVSPPPLPPPSPTGANSTVPRQEPQNLAQPSDRVAAAVEVFRSDDGVGRVAKYMDGRPPQFPHP